MSKRFWEECETRFMIGPVSGGRHVNRYPGPPHPPYPEAPRVTTVAPRHRGIRLACTHLIKRPVRVLGWAKKPDTILLRDIESCQMWILPGQCLGGRWADGLPKYRRSSLRTSCYSLEEYEILMQERNSMDGDIRVSESSISGALPEFATLLENADKLTGVKERCSREEAGHITEMNFIEKELSPFCMGAEEA